MGILDFLFPFTGLGAIISIPIIYGLCFTFIILGVFLIKKLGSKYKIVIWILVFVINSFIVVQLYPQDGSQTTLKKIEYMYNVIIDYEKITKDDLILYRNNKHNPFEKSITDDRERYVAALFKFRNEIKRDSTSFIYGRKDKPILENTKIKNHLQKGKDRVIWWILDTF